jgi:hypothetical protein
MHSKTEMKERGLEFGRALQFLLRQCAIYSAEHPVTQGPREQAFVIVSEIIKSSGQLTFGFAGDRILINNILTADPSLRSLRKDFLQRGVAAIVLLPSITAAAFKEFVTLLAITPKALLAQGGAKVYFERNRIEGTRVVLAPEGGGQEDVILRVNGEELIANSNWSAHLHAGGTLRSTASGDSLFESSASEATRKNWRRHLESILNATLLEARTESGGSIRAKSNRVEPLGGESNSSGRIPVECDANFVEDLAARWAVERLSTARSEAEIVLTYEGVAETLTRALATVIALQNTLRKIAHLSEEQHLDSAVLELVRRELAFSTLPLQEQSSVLLSIRRYSASQFRQLIAAIKALLQRGDVSAASKLAEHYASVMAEKDVTAEELSRAADLFQLFLDVPAGNFFAALQSISLESFQHVEDRERHERIVHLIGLQGQRALERQDWDSLLSVVDALETRLVSGLNHNPCCRTEMERLEVIAKLDDALETLISHRDIPASSRDAVSLCRAFGPRSAEKMTQRLETEQNAPTRLRLVRVIGQSGEAALRVVRPRLADPRWYVVRNACALLGDLGDPELLTQLAPALVHADERVQRSAVETLLRKRVAGREQALSECLAQMYAPVAEVVLDDFLMMRDPKCLPGIEKLLLNGCDGKAGLLLKAVQVAMVIDSSKARHLLEKITAEGQLPISVRHAASLALQRQRGRQSAKASQGSIAQSSSDPLTQSCRGPLQHQLHGTSHSSHQKLR